MSGAARRTTAFNNVHSIQSCAASTTPSQLSTPPRRNLLTPGQKQHLGEDGTSPAHRTRTPRPRGFLSPDSTYIYAVGHCRLVHRATYCLTVTFVYASPAAWLDRGERNTARPQDRGIAGMALRSASRRKPGPDDAARNRTRSSKYAALASSFGLMVDRAWVPDGMNPPWRRSFLGSRGAAAISSRPRCTLHGPVCAVLGPQRGQPTVSSPVGGNPTERAQTSGLRPAQAGLTTVSPYRGPTRIFMPRELASAAIRSWRPPTGSARACVSALRDTPRLTDGMMPATGISSRPRPPSAPKSRDWTLRGRGGSGLKHHVTKNFGDGDPEGWCHQHPASSSSTFQPLIEQQASEDTPLGQCNCSRHPGTMWACQLVRQAGSSASTQGPAGVAVKTTGNWHFTRNDSSSSMPAWVWH
ncbi:hypothetical protein ACCO45_005327 [Purpureocillium lilacinum]|uniref:Uncharacterized protein n=1 Tax=Purpureocillium lilacinum TaxID=33203 RepID=A0ACC4DV27_PURLI